MSVFNRKTLLVSAGLLVIPILGHTAVCTNSSPVGPYGYQEQGQAIGEGFSHSVPSAVLLLTGKETAAGSLRFGTATLRSLRREVRR